VDKVVYGGKGILPSGRKIDKAEEGKKDRYVVQCERL